MVTRFDRIEDTEFIQEVLDGLNPKIKSHLRRTAFIGYQLIGISEKLVLEILKNKELTGSLFYLDIDDEFKELTEEYLTTDEQFREANVKNHCVSRIYVATNEGLKFIIDKLPKK